MAETGSEQQNSDKLFRHPPRANRQPSPAAPLALRGVAFSKHWKMEMRLFPRLGKNNEIPFQGLEKLRVGSR